MARTGSSRDQGTRPRFIEKAATSQYTQNAAHPTAKTNSTARTELSFHQYVVVSQHEQSRRGPIVQPRSRVSSGVHSVPMGRTAAIVFYVAALILVVVAVDVLFFRHHFGARLAVNIGIVLVFGAFYWRFLHRA